MSVKKYAALLTSLLAFFIALAALSDAANHGAPAWLKLDPPIEVADEGFRGVMWCRVRLITTMTSMTAGHSR